MPHDASRNYPSKHYSSNDNLEQYRRRESLRFSESEMKENEPKKECKYIAESFIKNSWNVDMKESELHDPSQQFNIESTLWINVETTSI